MQENGYTAVREREESEEGGARKMAYLISEGL